jgi:ankyrin repeat protein
MNNGKAGFCGLLFAYCLNSVVIPLAAMEHQLPKHPSAFHAVGQWCNSDRHIATLRVLLALKMLDPNSCDETGYTLLMEAACVGHTEVTATLINAGAVVDRKTIYGNTALMSAVLYKHVAMMKCLLNAYAEPDIKNERGETALMLTSTGVVDNPQRIQAVKLLLDAHADPLLKDSDGQTALIKAARSGHVDTMQLVLARVREYCGELLADGWPDCPLDVINVVVVPFFDFVNDQDNNGKTALMHAAEWGYVEAVQFLLEQGADPAIKDNSNHTARDMVNDSQRMLAHTKEAVLALLP